MNQRISNLSYLVLGAVGLTASACSSTSTRSTNQVTAGTGGTGGEQGGPAGAGGSVSNASGSGGVGGSGGVVGVAGASAGSGGMTTPPAGGTAGSPPDPNMPPMRGDVGAPGFPGWMYSKSLTMDTSPQGAGVIGTVTNFPVAVVLTAETFDFTQAKPRGEDVRFGDSDGTPLPYELEHYDSQAQQATFWVLVPEIQGNNAAQAINLYWGNAAAGLADDSHAVFTEAGGFLGVWHLGEDGASDEGAFRDATAAENHGTGVNLMAGSSVPGLLGQGNQLLNAMRQWISVEDPDQRYRANELTASIWGVADGFPATWGSSGSPGYQCIYSSGEAWTIQRETGSRFESCLNHNCAIGDPMETGQWYHFAVRRSGGSHQFFMNGEQVASGGVATRNDAKPLGIGQMTQYLDPVQHVNERRSWEGTLDEARVMSTAVSDDWIKLDYESQRPGSTFLKFGAAVMR